MNKPILSVASIICALSICLMIFSLIKTDPSDKSETSFETASKSPAVSLPSFTPPKFDSNAVSGIPDVPEKLGYSPVNVKDAFNASVCGVVKIQNNAADIYFASDAKNAVWLKLRVLNEIGKTIAETGLLKPGEYVKKINFNKVPKIGDKIKLKMMAYEPETYYSAGSAALNTVIS